MWLYISGIVFFFGKLCVELFSLRNLLNATQLKSNAGFKLLETSEAITPFSFFNRIVYNPEQFDSEELKHIINHEKVHVSQWHSLDLLIAQICCVLFWFNPFIWGYKRAIQQNLEFIADDVAQGTSEENKAYQTVLLKTCLQTNPFQLTNNFYTSLIKTRILMLHKSKSKRLHKLKLLVILPLLAGFVMSFNTEAIYVETSNPLENPKTRSSLLQDRLTVTFTQDAEESYFAQAKASLAKKGITFTYKDINRNGSNEITAIHVTFKSKTQTTEYKVNGNEPIQPFIFESGADTFKARTLVKGQDIMYDILTDQYNKPITSDSSAVTKAANNTNFIVKEIAKTPTDTTEAKKNEKNTIARPWVLGNTFKIKTVATSALNDSIVYNFSEGVSVTDNDKVISDIISTKTYKPQPLFIIDDKIVSLTEFKRIEPNDIEIMSILKDKATSIYGDKAKYGVIIIETKESHKSKMLAGNHRLNVAEKNANQRSVSLAKVEYIEHEDQLKTIEFIVTKTSSDPFLEKQKNDLKTYGIEAKFSKIKRNDAGEITSLKIALNDNKGRKSSSSWNEKDQAIPDIVMGKSKDDKMFIRAIGQ
ncbi:hypothetical protein ESY86_16660 [Subsaximicrobium wynnwilliamsii]|uniref:Peptidase M56 domain-containing protein n=1 Tax=Subsaximicrobium wynnwilliamsii TaxID=291179 RepID=A0A5C6ZCL5_9FLAO|nr:M56 family metallopeptidase [Subsaximicrobium wynnwilliamsii]TXD81856.1 hypothetical protein ESY87_16560 [Subsaximicrobium wynnwilliamsii]TXD87525.1 hypothetical protein ESY86_16660 [Subsaximicrobium wynnwilliamsii]TXE01208.1 hypothetical protein ESY88_16910 [Subsaximicrobium wynnwilliamsii]